MNNDQFNHELDSDYYQSSSAFLGKTIVKVMVEANDDLTLWQSLTTEAKKQAQSNVEFELTPVFMESKTDSDGKDELIKLIDKCGYHYVLAMDSDYDYVACGHNKRSLKINEHEFVFQTYCYALENFRSVPSAVEPLITQACRKAPLPDELCLTNVIDELGELIYPFLQLLVYCKKTQVLPDIRKRLSDFYDEVSFNGFNGNFENKFAAIKCYVDSQFKELSALLDIQQLISSQDYKAWQQQVADKFKLQWYLMMRGHDLLDKIVKPLCKHYTRHRSSEAFKAISSRKSADVGDKIKQYENTQVGINLLIDNNTQFDKAVVFEHCVADLKQFIQKYH